MNVKTLIAASVAAFAALGAASVHAQNVPQNAWYLDLKPSNVTRAEVRAEVETARLLGQLPQYGEATVFDASAVQSLRDRAEVRAEAVGALRGADASETRFHLNIGG